MLGITTDELLKRINKTPVGFLIFSGGFDVIFISESFKRLAKYYHFKYPEDNLNNDLLDLNVLRDDLSYLSLGYSFEKPVKSIVTPGVGKISLVMKGVPFYEGDNFAGGILTAEDFKLSSSEETAGILGIHDILKTSGDFIFLTDKNGRIRFSSGRKYSADVIYHNIFELIPQHKQEEFKSGFNEAGLKRNSVKVITPVLFDQKGYECRIDPLLNAEGVSDYFLFTLNEVSDIINENLKLKSELRIHEKFRSAADSAEEMIYIYDKNFQLLYSNRKAELLPDAAEYFGKKELLEKISEQNTFTVECEIENKFYKGIFILTAEDIVACSCREITSEKLELNKIKESRELLHNIISGADIIILNITPQGNILFSNRYFRENFITPEMNFFDAVEKSYAAGFKIPSEKISEVEIPLLSHNAVTYYSFSFNPVISAEGNIKYISAAGININAYGGEKKELSIYRDIFSNAGDGIAVAKDGKIYLANNTFAGLFGYDDVNELKGKRLSDLSSLEQKDKILDQIREIELSGFSTQMFEFSGKKKNGSDFYVSVSLSPFSAAGFVYTIMICRDVTERRRVQKVIRDSEEKFRNITENIDDFLFTYERIGRISKPVFYTASVEKITGYTYKEFLSDSRLMLKIVHPDDFSSVKKKLKTLFRSRLQTAEELEFRLINTNGNIVWVRCKINLVRNDDASIEKIYGLISDITLRKKAENELKHSAENLMKLNDAKDRFISIISHDLRTPFSSILGFTDLLLNDDELTEEEKKQYARYIQESSKSMLALVNSLLDWTRLQTGRIKFEPEKFSAASVVNESVRTFTGSAFQKHIDIVSNVKEESTVFADKSLLLQVFNNLISNAIKFTRPDGQITISANPSEKLRFLQFSVKDNGVGIDELNLKNLFRVETKFTSEGTAGEKGSGLGLSLVKEIIEKHGGDIWVESKKNQGSEFIFTIPVTPSNILLVDDSNTDRLLYSKLLKNFAPDYNIETAVNGKDALEKILQSPPALIITDHLMPEINGYELILQLKKSNLPEIPPAIVLSSGLDRNTISSYIDAGIEHIFQKPVNLVEFKSAVEKLLRKGYLQ